LWDGRNRTILGNGFWTYPISVGPAAMLHLGKDTYFPEWRGNVLVGQGGPTHQAGPSHSGRFEIRRFPVRAGRGLTGKPARVVSFKGQYQQILVPVAEGPDGLYFSGFLPGPDGRTTLLKVVRREGATADVAFLTGAELYHEKGCDGCHQIGGQGGSVGPALDGVVDRLLERLGSSQYAAKLDAVDELETEVHIQYRDARDELRKLAGDDAVRFWLRRHLEQPRFDAAQSQMPDLQLSDEEVDQLATYVMTLRGPRDPKLGAKDAAYLRLVRFFQSGSLMRPEVGFLAGVLALFLVQRVTRRVRRRST
jgi:mono/diheme cytochrome c family protein